MDPPNYKRSFQMRTLQHLFDNNREWADKNKSADPDFFLRLSEGQKPDYLWIGCSDSRVQPATLVNLPPGKLFVHRNIANLIIHTDLNCLSVIQYAVEVLKVPHIIICGHYGCGGLQAVLDQHEHGLIDNWLQHARDIYHRHFDSLQAFSQDKEKLNTFCEINVIEQVYNICNTPTIQRVWKSGQQLSVHGLIYNLEDGLLKNMNICVSGIHEIPVTTQ